MLSIYDQASALKVLSQPLDQVLRTLITNRLADAHAIDFADQTHIVVVQPGDTEAMLLEEIGWSPLVDPLNEERFGSPDFEPYWAWLQDLGGWFELLHPVGNSGFAYILLISRSPGVLPELLAMCEAGVSTCA